VTQFAKEAIREQILASAREEFVKYGFAKASIRTIAAHAQTAKSNVYNYFADKDALFYAVLEPVVCEIRSSLEEAAKNADASGGYTIESQQSYMLIIMNYVASHHKDVSMLLSAQGSSLAGFKDEILETFTDVLSGWLKNAMPGRAPSRVFIRCVADFYLSIIERMLEERPSQEQAGEYMKEFLAFVYGGWRSVIDSLPGK
jgi:TetR/AcrR family transcriptional regulator, cholesterol catabolism regulator